MKIILIKQELTFCLLLFFYLNYSSLMAAKFIDNRLYFDIFLFDDDKVSLKSNSNFFVGQDTTVCELDHTNFLSLEYVRSKEQFFIISREIVNDLEFRADSIFINDWSDGKFIIKKVPVSVSRSSYSTKQRAEVKANAYHLKSYKIIQEPGKIRVISINRNLPVKEMNLPITVISANPIIVNQISYNGMITFKDSYNGSLRVINTIEMEEYVAGVIPCEIGTDAPYEALKAQAVAARSQTLFKILSNRHVDDGYDLCNTVHCQVYKGLDKQTESTYRASIETSGQVLLFNNEVIDAVFHSSCGGRTENSKDVWSKDIPYLRSLSDSRVHNIDLRSERSIEDYLQSDNRSYCSEMKSKNAWYKNSYEWEKTYSLKELSNKLKIGAIKDLIIIKRGESGRIIKLKIIGTQGSEILNKELNIRSFFNHCNSSFFTFEIKQDKITLYGKGMGHGVGMCQLGAIAQAYEGYLYNDILTFYFQNCVLSQEWILDKGYILGE